MPRSFVFLVALSLASLCTMLAPASAAQGKTQRGQLARLSSDATDYAPDSIATLTGSGFLANEIVTVQVLHSDGTPSSGADHDPWNVAANGFGRFTTTWHVCNDDCIGSLLTATAVGNTSGLRAHTVFLDSHDCGTGVVTSVTPVGGSCSAFTPAVGAGPDNYEVHEGGTYVMTIMGVTECSGDTITVFVQSSSVGNFCFNAVGGSGTYAGTFTMPDPACNTMPVSYKCGANATCSHPGSLATQGPTSGCGGVHLRTSNFDGNCNKTGDDGDCNPPPPTGSCCLVDGSCVEVTEDDCAVMGGTYGGDGSSCVGVSCPSPAGACCLADGTCVQVTMTDCLNMGGTYNGDGSMCKDIGCPQPPGACCLIDGTCVEVTEEDCNALGGTFSGDGTLCVNTNCPTSIGACCLADGTCVQVTASECGQLGGTYTVDGTLCMDVSCPPPPGACCLMDGTCVFVIEADCIALGGTFQGVFTQCGDVFCPDLTPDCFTLDFESDDDGNPMAHGTKVDVEYDCSGSEFPITVTGSVNASGANSCAILNSTTGPATQDPDLLVNRGNILILQNDANLTECPPASGVYCSHNDDEDGGRLIFDFCVPASPESIVLVDIDATDPTSTVTLTDVNGKTRTYTVPANWTGDLVTNATTGWKELFLNTLAAQPGYASTATASEQAGYDGAAVTRIVVRLGGSGAVDDLKWCQ